MSCFTRFDEFDSAAFTKLKRDFRLVEDLEEAEAEAVGFGLVVEPGDLEGAFDEPLEPETDEERLLRHAQSAATFEEYYPGGVAEFHRQERIAAGREHACLGCGCSESRACPGGCVWATETLCSSCAAKGAPAR